MNENDRVDELVVDEEAPIEIPKPYFVAKTALTADLQLEATKAAASKLNRLLTYACFGILVVLMSVVLWMYVATPTTTYLVYLAVMVLVMGFLVYSHFFGQKRSLQRWERQILERYGTSALHLVTEFYDLTFLQTVTETENETDCGYSAIEKVLETEHLYLLRKGKSSWYFVEKCGIESNTAESFGAFIRQKCGG